MSQVLLSESDSRLKLKFPVTRQSEADDLTDQSESLAREGIDLDVSTMADWVGACTAALAPLVELIRLHVLGAARLHGDDTTVPVLAKGKTVTGRVWTYVRDDRPFAGPAPPAAVFFYSRNRDGEHPKRHLAGYAASFRPTLMAGSIGFTIRREVQPPSPRRPAGATDGGSSLSWPISPSLPRAGNSGHRSPSRLCDGSTRSSQSRAR